MLAQATIQSELRAIDIGKFYLAFALRSVASSRVSPCFVVAPENVAPHKLAFTRCDDSFPSSQPCGDQGNGP
jgi:hypothetical protein